MEKVLALEEIGFEVKKKRKMRDFIDKNVNAGYNDQMRAADAIPNINLSLPHQEVLKNFLCCIL